MNVYLKCKDCSSCKKGYFASRPDEYVCIGVKVPFIIDDIEGFCTKYPEKNREENNAHEGWCMELSYFAGQGVMSCS